MPIHNRAGRRFNYQYRKCDEEISELFPKSDL